MNAWKALAVGMASVGLLGCAAQQAGEITDGTLAYAASPATYSWMLPKTTLTVTVSYVLTQCVDGAPAQDAQPAKSPKLEITPTLSITSAAEPDTRLGDNFPDGVLSITPTDAISYWQDSDISVKTNSTTHLLTLLSSKPTNEVTQIVSNVLTGVVKLAAVSMGVSPVAAVPAGAKICGTAAQTLDKLAKLKEKLSSPDVTPDDAKNLPAQIAALQSDLTISVTHKYDPGEKPIYINRKTLLASLGTLQPTDAQLQGSNWFADKNITLASLDRLGRGLMVDLYMDFNGAFPKSAADNTIGCNDRTCRVFQVPLPKGTLFREVLYVPVLAAQRSAPGRNIYNKTFPFGQFGLPRTMPMTASAFEQLTWSIGFADTGEITDASFTSKAKGLGLSSLFSNGASAVNSIASESRSAAVAVDPATTKLQNENNAIKAQIDNINYTQQLNALLAARH